MNKVDPLKKKTMTLSALQLRTLKVLRLVRLQLYRDAHEDGLSDSEFIDQVLDPLKTDILQDRHIIAEQSRK